MTPRWRWWLFCLADRRGLRWAWKYITPAEWFGPGATLGEEVPF